MYIPTWDIHIYTLPKQNIIIFIKYPLLHRPNKSFIYLFKFYCHKPQGFYKYSIKKYNKNIQDLNRGGYFIKIIIFCFGYGNKYKNV